MELFTMKHAHRKHRMNLVSLHPAKANGKPAAGMYFVSCGAYRKGEKTGRMEYQGLALEGDVPVKELVRWAKRKGFMKWHRNGHVQTPPVHRNGQTTKQNGTHKGGAKQHERNTDADHLTNLVYDPKTIPDKQLEADLDEARKHPEAIPDYAFDCHTQKGRKAGKTKRQFFHDEFRALQPREKGLFDDLVE